jgi:hypothetical protein
VAHLSAVDAGIGFVTENFAPASSQKDCWFVVSEVLKSAPNMVELKLGWGGLPPPLTLKLNVARYW